MPYVNRETRDGINSIDDVNYAGELNYFLTRQVVDYIDKHGASYTIFNEVLGVLECMKLELYRRMIAPYEDVKKCENGDVYYDKLKF